MIPVKKTINPNNTNPCPWLLCPSKSIPGKFYYFNGSTGEAAWTISDTDKTLKKDTIHKITDKAHSYPEPVGPPIDENTNTTNSFSSLKNATPEFTSNTPKDVNHVPLPAPMFGQAVFPKYVTDVSTPKVIWAFTPLYLLEQPMQHQPMQHQPMQQQPMQQQPMQQQPMQQQPMQHQPVQHQHQTMQQHKEMRDGITQTYNTNPVFIQNVTSNNPFQNVTSNNPFQNVTSNNLFQNIKRTLNFTPDFQFNQKPTYQNFQEQPTFGQTPTYKKLIEEPIFGQTSTYNLLNTSNAHTFGTKQKEVCQTFIPIKKIVRTQSESDSTPKSVLKSSRSVENLTSLFTKDIVTSTMSPDDKTKSDKLRELSKNDLRFLLVGKKKKAVSNEAPKSTDQSKSRTQETLTSKKRVTFDLQQSRDTGSEDSLGIDQSLNSSQEENLISEGPLWYVVTDTSALLSQLQIIEQFVKKDPFCRLLIPYGVYKDVEALSRGDCGVVAARLLLRRLAVATSHVVVQSKSEYEHASTEDSVLQCCWDLLQRNCHVVLITDDKTMRNKAKSIELECHTLDEIVKMKENQEPTSDRLNEIKNMKIIVTNDTKKSENLFLQDLSEINNFPFSKINGYSVKIDQSKKKSAESKDNVFSQKEINSDKLINLTKPKNLKSCEISNVKDKILNLSIADNSAVRNRTKLILENVFRNTQVNKTNQDKRYVFGEKNINQNLSEINKMNSINQGKHEISNEINLDIRKQNVNENKPVRAKDKIKVSGITKLSTHFNLDEELERFRVKNGVMENRIKSRLEEWLCRLNQIMEGSLTDILLKEKVKVKKMMPPWNLFEAIQVTGEVFKKQPNIKIIVDRFSIKHFDCTSNNGKLIKNMKPNDLMKLVGFSMILIQNLKEILNHRELNEADDMMSDLIKNMEDPNTDIDLTLEKVITPIFCRSDIPEPKTPIAFRKSDSEVIGYLKKHFDAWKSYEIDSPEETNDITETTAANDKEPNVVRTFGKNLNMLKINNTKTITMETDKVNVEPKVIRNVKIIEAFEEKLKRKQELDLNKLDYEASLYTLTGSSEDEDNLVENDATAEKPDDLTENNYIEDLDCELDTECVRAYPLVKIFLVKLKRTFIRIYCFINDSMMEYQKGMTKDKKADVKLKTEMARGYVLKIAERLKSIIARESGNVMTLKDLLIKAGDYVEDDKVISNYREVVGKYLEQAQILEEALTILLSLSNASKTEREGYSGTFKTSSPIVPKHVLRGNQMVLVTEEV